MLMENYGKSSLKVKQGDIVEIEEIEIKETKLQAQEIPLDIIYEDTDIIVVNKPKGLVVQYLQRFIIWHWRGTKTGNCT